MRKAFMVTNCTEYCCDSDEEPKSELHFELDVAYEALEDWDVAVVENFTPTEENMEEFKNLIVETYKNFTEEYEYDSTCIFNEIENNLKSLIDSNMFVRVISDNLVDQSYNGYVIVESNYSVDEISVRVFDADNECNCHYYWNGLKGNRVLSDYHYSVEEIELSDDSVLLDEWDSQNNMYTGQMFHHENIHIGKNEDKEDKYYIVTTSQWAGSDRYVVEFDSLNDVLNYIGDLQDFDRSVEEYKKDILCLKQIKTLEE